MMQTFPVLNSNHEYRNDEKIVFFPFFQKKPNKYGWKCEYYCNSEDHFLLLSLLRMACSDCSCREKCSDCRRKPNDCSFNPPGVAACSQYTSHATAIPNTITIITTATTTTTTDIHHKDYYHYLNTEVDSTTTTTTTIIMAINILLSLLPQLPQPRL